MPLELRFMVKEDAQEATAILLESFQNNPFRAIVLPTGLSQASIDKTVDARQKAVDDPDQFALKIVDTDNNDKMVGSAVWIYTKAMTDEDWETEEPKIYPESRTDILNDIIAKDMVMKRQIMGHTRWLGELVPALHVPIFHFFSGQLSVFQMPIIVSNRTGRPQYAARISTPRYWIHAHEIWNGQD